MSQPVPESQTKVPAVPEPQEAQVRLSAFEFGVFRLELLTRQLVRGGETISLTPKAFDVLVALIRHRDRVFTKEELLATVWPNAFVTEDSLTQNIWAIRRALGDDPAQPTYVTTIPRVGYRFIARVDEVVLPERSTAPVHRDAPTAGPRSAATSAFESSASSYWRYAMVAAALALGVGLGAVVSSYWSADAQAEARVPVVFAQGAPEGTVLLPGVALSPDGRTLAFVAQNLKSRRASLWLRDLGSGEVRILGGTEGGEQPFWSPKSNALGFFADGLLKTVDLNGDSVQVIVEVGVLPQGGSWNNTDTILFAPWTSGLFTVASSGGAATPVTKLDRAVTERSHRRPIFLPDGKHFLYSVASSNEEVSGTYVGTVGASTRFRVFDASVLAVQFAPPDRVIGVRGGALVEARVDMPNARAVGPVKKLEGRLVPPGYQARAGFSVSAAGLLAFGGGSNSERLMTFTRDGKMERVLSARATLNPVLSPSGDEMLTTGREGQAGVWVVDLERDVSTKLLPAGSWPMWSPDGSMLAFSSPRRVGDIYLRRLTGHDDEQVIVSSPELKVINDWSRDGKYLVFARTNSHLKQDLWMLPMQEGQTEMPYLQTGFSQIQAQVSPDGRWLAYASDESGRWEVYVQSFPVPGAKRIVSVGGGGEPKWRGDGRELFYVRADMNLMSVAIPQGDPSVSVGTPETLFTVPVVGDISTYRSRYDVSARGDRFLFNALDESNQPPVTIYVNWDAHLLPN